MYSRRRIIQKYLYYLFTASNGKGHGIHSPFVFDFITHVLNADRNDPISDRIERLRKQMLADNRTIPVEDFGAGSGSVNTRIRRIADITRHAAKSKKYGRLLSRIASYYQPRTILELGTSVGISTAYLAGSSPLATVFTLEGDPETAVVAAKNFETLGLSKIQLIKGNFDTTLGTALNMINSIDLAFIDGNHRKEPTLDYFRQLLRHKAENSLFVFDDIHWSEEMELAWEEIKRHPSVLLTIDLFFLGLVFFRNEFHVKQHFTVRF